MRKQASFSLAMAIFITLQSSFRACRSGRQRHLQITSNTPLFMGKKLQRSINRHKAWKSAQKWETKEMCVFPLHLEKSYLLVSHLPGFLHSTHQLSVYIPGIQYLAVTSNTVRNKHVNLIIYCPWEIHWPEVFSVPQQGEQSLASSWHLPGRGCTHLQVLWGSVTICSLPLSTALSPPLLRKSPSNLAARHTITHLPAQTPLPTPTKSMHKSHCK